MVCCFRDDHDPPIRFSNGNDPQFPNLEINRQPPEPDETKVTSNRLYSIDPEAGYAML